jgi:heparin binding hemagglutinin HbhA
MSDAQDPKDQNETPKDPNDLGDELRELGQQIEQAIRSALESDRARQVQSDVSSGLREIGAQVQSAIKAIHDDPRLQELVERGEQAVDKARESKAAQDLSDALARGVSQLNEQLSSFVERLQSSDQSAGEATTGETTRLDPEDDKDKW